MNKKEYCTSHAASAYYSGLDGLEINGIEYGIDDYIYCTSGAWYGPKKYHKVKVSYNNAGSGYITVNGHRVPLNELIRRGL